EPPKAARRVSGFFSSALLLSVLEAGFASGAFGAGMLTATAIETGPVRSPLSVSGESACGVSSEPRFVSAQLRCAVWMNDCAGLVVFSVIGVIARASGNIVISWNRSVIGCEG